MIGMGFPSEHHEKLTSKFIENSLETQAKRILFLI
jgi:hypothetical protein